jgi:probable F420-dependent oxidoreductase
MEIGKIGLWGHTGSPLFDDADALAEVENLGIGAVWVGANPNPDLTTVEPVIARSKGLVVGTGIVNVWDAPPETAAEGYRRVAGAHPDRLILGIGVGHRSMIGDRYTKPYDKLVSYLDSLDEGGVPVEGRVLAALGPRVLALAGERAAGAHPYYTTPEHTAQAREILGADKLLVPEQKVVLETDPEVARRLARETLDFYLKLSNYTNNWLRLGFTEEDLADGGSDRLVDALTAWGDEEAIRARVQAHFDAGADQVIVQVLNEDILATLRVLGPVLK